MNVDYSPLTENHFSLVSSNSVESLPSIVCNEHLNTNLLFGVWTSVHWVIVRYINLMLLKFPLVFCVDLFFLLMPSVIAVICPIAFDVLVVRQVYDTGIYESLSKIKPSLCESMTVRKKKIAGGKNLILNLKRPCLTQT